MKKVMLIGAILVLILMAGCKTEHKNESGLTESATVSPLYHVGAGRMFAETADGYYWLSNSYIYCSEKETGKSTVLCSRVNCNHVDDTCNAFVSGAFDIYAGEDGLYLVESGHKTGNHLIRISFDGNVRENVLEHEEGDIIVYDFIVEKGEFFFFASVFEENEDDATGKVHFKRRDLKTGVSEIIFTLDNHEEGAVQGINVTETGFFIDMFLPSMVKSLYYDDGSKTITEAFFAKSEENKDVYYETGACLYYAESDWRTYADFYKKDVLTGEEERLCQLSFVSEGYWRMDANHIYFYNQKENYIHFYVYDLAGELINEQEVAVENAQDYGQRSSNAEYLFFHKSVPREGERQKVFRISIEELKAGTAEAEEIFDMPGFITWDK